MLRTNTKEEDLKIKFDKAIRILGSVLQNEVSSEYHKLVVMEMLETKLRVPAGRIFTKCVTLVKVIKYSAVHKLVC